MGISMTKRTKNTFLDDLARMMAEGFAETATKTDIVRLENRIDGVDTRLGGVETRLDGVETRLGNVEVRLDGIDNRLDDTNKRLGKVETKLDRALYREISRHDNLIHQLAVKTHVKLEY
jgi:septal ring factor EnvC (AmiA/AmiB activator)